MDANNLNDDEFSYYLTEYEQRLKAVKAPEWGSRGIHAKDGHYITFRDYVAWGESWEACFRYALDHYENKPDDNEGWMRVTGLDDDAIAAVQDVAEKFPYIPPEQLRALMELERDSAAYEQFAAGKLPENTHIEILQGALAEAIRREAFEHAARLHALITKKS